MDCFANTQGFSPRQRTDPLQRVRGCGEVERVRGCGEVERVRGCQVVRWAHARLQKSYAHIMSGSHLTDCYVWSKNRMKRTRRASWDYFV